MLTVVESLRTADALVRSGQPTAAEQVMRTVIQATDPRELLRFSEDIEATIACFFVPHQRNALRKLFEDHLPVGWHQEVKPPTPPSPTTVEPAVANQNDPPPSGLKAPAMKSAPPKNGKKRKRRRDAVKVTSAKRLPLPRDDTATKIDLLQAVSHYKEELDAALKQLDSPASSLALSAAWQASREIELALRRAVRLDKVAMILCAGTEKPAPQELPTLPLRPGKVIWTGQSRKPGSHKS
jgi:hypothetical protein